MFPPALALIFPDPSIVMSFPLIVIVPSFFIVILALPVVSVNESAAVIARVLPTSRVSLLPTLWDRPPPTETLSSLETLMPMRQLAEKVMHASVQITGLKRSMFGQVAPAWTGSGTVIDPRGIILTNCHVANPQAMGMQAPQANRR